MLLLFWRRYQGNSVIHSLSFTSVGLPPSSRISENDGYAPSKLKRKRIPFVVVSGKDSNQCVPASSSLSCLSSFCPHHDWLRARLGESLTQPEFVITELPIFLLVTRKGREERRDESKLSRWRSHQFLAPHKGLCRSLSALKGFGLQSVKLFYGPKIRNTKRDPQRNAGTRHLKPKLRISLATMQIFEKFLGITIM